MNRPALRRFLDDHFCGCGSPELAAAALMTLLDECDRRGPRAAFEGRVADDGARFLLLYWLDQVGLTEHGSSVEASWPTDKGTAVLEGLRRESVDGFEGLFGDHCIHGFDVDDDSHDCFDDESGAVAPLGATPRPAELRQVMSLRGYESPC